MAISEQLLKKLVCPHCGGELKYDEDKQVLICEESRLVFKITDDIPVMLVDEADQLG